MNPAARSAPHGPALTGLLPFMKGFRRRLALALLVGIADQALGIAAAVTAVWLVGLAATGHSARAVGLGVVLLGVLVIARAAAAWAEMWMVHDIAYRILAVLRVRVYDALERLAPAYLLGRRTGDLASTVMADVELTEEFFAHTVISFLVAVVVPFGALAVLGTLHPLLLAAVLPFLAAIATVPVWLAARSGAQGRELRARLGEVNADVVDGVQGLRELVAFGRGTAWLDRIGRGGAALYRAQLAHGRRSGAEHSAADALVTLGMATVLVTGSLLVSDHRLPATTLPVAVILAVYCFAPLNDILSTARNFGAVRAATDRVFTVLDTPPTVTDLASRPPPPPVDPHVRFRRVTFGYGTRGPDVLHDVSFAVAPGETVALVGHSGAGKSTCAHLLMRFWDARQGSVSVGGHDVRAFPQAVLRELITLVPQEVYLFNTSVAENIRIGRQDATRAQVVAAARRAIADDFVRELPHGYDTVIGERGAQLSGGQRQRIAIARAFLRDAPVLVMDEAVSSLDAENTALLQAAMKRLQAGRTTLLVAHRLSTIRSADRIVVLAGGRVAESGTHAHLLARDGVYARLIASQHDGVVDTPRRPGGSSHDGGY
ncbi:ABC transporter ATP-binding protein [Streptomyces sp. MNP-20]|uniref:ABC transporter ATP-binding protein n=1 Tax=Streptomyces sp. MNP-20 TaxID=2721165 RepID=UPI0015563E6C|nr:ABC transporter ATP-binding protein [Streptomyces sp. MNP-20]